MIPVKSKERKLNVALALYALAIVVGNVWAIWKMNAHPTPIPQGRRPAAWTY